MNAVHPSAILVVDDNVDHAIIARLVLRGLAPDVTVSMVHTAEAAIPAAMALPLGALVLIDRRLGGVESFDAVVQLRMRRPDVAVVMMSAALTTIDRAAALASGALDGIEKPGNLEGWRGALGAIVDSSSTSSRAA